MAKILITSALPYVNNVPHLGNIIGAVLSADVFARFCRSFGNDCIYICGTDEHGTATETKAIEEGVTPKQICDKYFKIHKDIYDWFNISFDEFGRTSTPEQTELTQDIFLKLQKNGYITEDIVEQHYCEKCQKFLADRFVEGKCPYCGFEDARGDQCDNCSRMLNAAELKEPRCKICGSTPIIKKTEHLFIDLPKIKPKLLKWIDKSSKNWSNNAKTMTYSWIKEGLKKRAISRDLKWGVQIPVEKYKDKVFYVWFDAPIGYISITKRAYPDKWESWWKDDKNVRLYQFMGKDNVPFHTIIFPSSLIGSGDKWTMLYKISSTEYLNYEDGKFSKSRMVGVFGTDAMDTGISPDVFRYYLLVNRPEKSDSAFHWKDLQEKNNNELVANLGNLVNRTMTFIKKFFDSKVPAHELADNDKKFIKALKEEEKKVKELLENVELKEALKQIMHISKLGNQYFQECEPWKNRDTAPASMYVLANLVSDLAVMIEPYMPDTSKKIFSQLNIDAMKWDSLSAMPVKPGHKLNQPEILFTKIEDEGIDVLINKFSGNQTNKFQLNIKAAKIIEAKPHPDADRLVILKVDIGDEKRQIVAGIRKYYSVDELKGKMIVVVTNLKPAKLRGEESNGMLLAASKDDKTCVLVDAEGCSPGDQLFAEGMENNEDQVEFSDFQKIQLEVKNKKILAENNVLDTESGKIKIDADDGWTVR